MRFEITYLHTDGGDHPSHEASLDEITMLVEWAGRTGVPVGIRPVTGPPAPDFPQHRKSRHD
ncbi:hypothetical protein [Streptomyces inhibens]|uniref:hypothetical protein n=1 Tax=Streptomyces inhibens TaxID=2293571 RepID=UPI001EE716D2|nr:hypothetical protein [Streptomyces inhibens]UKY48540.1 hypothetical protein KI385_06840 [Streptomyces inhibens]